MKIGREIFDLVEIEQNFRHCTWRPKCIIWLAVH